MTVMSTCGMCRGSGQMTKDVCNGCGGRGAKPERIKKDVEFLPGFNAEPLVLMGEGHKFIKHAKPGNVIIAPMMERDPDVNIGMAADIVIEVEVDPILSLFGGKVEVESPFEETMDIFIHPSKDSRRVVRVPSRGLPLKYGDADDRGFLTIGVVAAFPDDITEEQEVSLKHYLSLRSAGDKEGNDEEAGERAESSSEEVCENVHDEKR